MTKVLLYSGGMDSWLINKIWQPDVLLYVNMHTKYSEEEMKRLPEDVIIEDLDLSKWERSDAIIPLRNLYLVMIASNYGNEICLGATSGDRVLDKSEEFAEKTSDLLSYLYQPQHWTNGKKIKINLDFKKYTKKQLVKEFIMRHGNIQDAVEASFSCYNPIDGHECWECKPCFRKYVAFKVNGYEFGPKIDEKVREYIRVNVLPDVLAGTYGRGVDEEKDIMEVYRWRQE